MRVALELQLCCGNRSGIRVYIYELAKHLKDQNGLQFCGNLFNFCGRNDNSVCPVVCSNATSLPEEVGKAVELVDFSVEDSIAEGIWKILSNSEYAKELIQEGYAQTKKLTWKKSAEQLTQVCREMLGV